LARKLYFNNFIELIKRIKLLRKIGFENYKSFKNYTELEIKPITVLVGPNSAGKSSVINLLKILIQSVNNPQKNIILNAKYGPLIKVNDSLELFHNKSKNKKLRLSLDFDYTRVGYDYYENPISLDINLLFNKEFSFVINANKRVDNRVNPNSPTKLSSFYDYKLAKKKYKIEVVQDRASKKYYNSIDLVGPTNKQFNSLLANLHPNITSQLNSFVSHFTNHKNIQALFDSFVGNFSYKFNLNGLIIENYISEQDNINREAFFSDIRDEDFSFFERLEIKDNIGDELSKIIESSQITKKLFNSENQFYKNLLKRRTKEVFSKIYSYYKSKKKLTQKESVLIISFLYQELFFPIFHNYFEYFDNMIKELNLANSLRDCFKEIKVFNPLREAPKSSFESSDLINYFPELSQIQNATQRKNSLILINDTLNKLYNSIGFAESISLEPSIKYPHIFVLQFHSGENPKFSLSNVGFGHSQIIPIIFETASNLLRNQDNLTIIEQPELHLHPNIQYKLAELFENYGMLQWDEEGKTFSRKNQRTSQLVIETHSEHLIRGFQVQVAKGNLSKDDIAIYYVSKNENGVSSLMEMELHDNGLFKSKWPKGFFDVTLEASLELLGD